MLTQHQFLVLWNMENSYGTDLERATSLAGFDVTSSLLVLERKSLAKVERRDGKIYAFVATNEGQAELERAEYARWID